MLQVESIKSARDLEPYLLAWRCRTAEDPYSAAGQSLAWNRQLLECLPPERFQILIFRRDRELLGFLPWRSHSPSPPERWFKAFRSRTAARRNDAIVPWEHSGPIVGRSMAAICHALVQWLGQRKVQLQIAVGSNARLANRLITACELTGLPFQLQCVGQSHLVSLKSLDPVTLARPWKPGRNIPPLRRIAMDSRVAGEKNLPWLTLWRSMIPQLYASLPDPRLFAWWHRCGQRMGWQETRLYSAGETLIWTYGHRFRNQRVVWRMGSVSPGSNPDELPILLTATRERLIRESHVEGLASIEFLPGSLPSQAPATYPHLDQAWQVMRLGNAGRARGSQWAGRQAFVRR